MTGGISERGKVCSDNFYETIWEMFAVFRLYHMSADISIGRIRGRGNAAAAMTKATAEEKVSLALI